MFCISLRMSVSIEKTSLWWQTDRKRAREREMRGDEMRGGKMLVITNVVAWWLHCCKKQFTGETSDTDDPHDIIFINSILLSQFASFLSVSQPSKCVRTVREAAGGLCLSGRPHLNNLMRQGSNNYQTEQPEWEVTTEGNPKQRKCLHTRVWVSRWLRLKKGTSVFTGLVTFTRISYLLEMNIKKTQTCKVIKEVKNWGRFIYLYI